MDWKELSPSADRARSAITSAFNALLDVALDQHTGVAGLTMLWPGNRKSQDAPDFGRPLESQAGKQEMAKAFPLPRPSFNDIIAEIVKDSAGPQREWGQAMQAAAKGILAEADRRWLTQLNPDPYPRGQPEPEVIVNQVAANAVRRAAAALSPKKGKVKRGRRTGK